tara:strand:- start:568 stop:834 length:267 start_codon:yes stop_codon:yes gene_type:complete
MSENGFNKMVMLGWLINIVAWVLFLATGNHVIEIIMGLACVYAAYIGYSHKVNNLIYSSAFDAVWMFAWGFGLFGSAGGGLLDLLDLM